MLTQAQVELLLYDLCVTYGFCLPPKEQTKLIAEPPETVDGFTDAVYRAEGMNPSDPSPRGRRLREEVRARIAQTFGYDHA